MYDLATVQIPAAVLSALPAGGSLRRPALFRCPVVAGQQRINGRTSTSGLDLYLFLAPPVENGGHAQCDAMILDGLQSVYFDDLRLDELPILFAF